MSGLTGIVPRDRRPRLRLFWKLLLPFLALILVMGIVGALLIVGYLSAQAQNALDQDLSRRKLSADAAFLDNEARLLDTARLLANLQGMPEAARKRDAKAVSRLVVAALKLKTSADLAVVTDAGGKALVEVLNGRPSTSGRSWANEEVVGSALGDAQGEKRSGFLTASGRPFFAVVAPIRRPGGAQGAIDGVTLVARALETIAREAAARTGAAVSFYGPDGALLAGSSLPVPRSLPERARGAKAIRITERRGGRDVTTLYAPLTVGGARAGTQAIAVRGSPIIASARQTAIRLAQILLMAMAGVVAIGALLSRAILRQVRPLVEANRALAQGELSIRAPVVSGDELGELARGFNHMAEELQASYEELERRVVERTRELAQRTEQLQQAHEELRQTYREKSEFFAHLSHEFRTPLFAIGGTAEMLQDSTIRLSTRERGEFAATIKESSDRLLKLVNDILNFSKMEAARFDLDLTDVELHDVVEGVRSTITQLARTSEIDVSYDLDSGLPTIRADRERLGDIVLNLVSNAIKYTPPGGRVTIAATPRDGHVLVSVRDTGVGIPKAELPRIFAPFYRVKGSQPARGEASTGLGLALTKYLIEAQGGEITVKSRVGAGTTFTFTLLPATRDRPPRRPAGSTGARQGAD